MPLYVNLSSIFKLKPIIPDSLMPFVKLCNDYSKSRCLCSKTLFGLSNFVWVLKQYKSNQKLFDQYKLGRITTDQFLDNLLNIFSFLKDNKKVEDPKKLLADAWNNMIVWDQESTLRLNQLIKHSQTDGPIFLLSNTNLLHTKNILSLFKGNLPLIEWDMSVLDAKNAQKPLQIAPNIYLCLSFQYGLYKEGTPGLVEALNKQLEISKDQVTVVSQYAKDLEIAQQQGLKSQAASDFYAPSNLGLKINKP